MSSDQIRSDIFTLLFASIEVEFTDAVAAAVDSSIHHGVKIPETPINYRFKVQNKRECPEIILPEFERSGTYKDSIALGYNRIATSLNGLIGQPASYDTIRGTAHKLSEAMGKKIDVRPTSIELSRAWRPSNESSLEIIVGAAKQLNAYTNPVRRALQAKQPELQITGFGLPLSQFIR